MSINIERSVLKQIKNTLFKEKVVIIYGARRTGKTTLVREILSEYGDDAKYVNCENLINKESLETTNVEKLKAFLGDKKLVVLDEAQTIDRIGHILKLLVDTYPEMQIIATGSSSFQLSNQVGEPLVGRSREFILYPLSIGEMKNYEDLFYVEANLEKILRFGSMPSVLLKSDEDAVTELIQITSNYLYKDILAFEGLKKPSLVVDILKALALQLGSEVSLREVGDLVSSNHHTVMRYIDLLEKTHIIFSLDSLSRNPRNEIKRGKKIYFYDLGIRNTLIQNHNPLNIRNDIGALWENFCILEMMKKSQQEKRYYNHYFWRSRSQKEIDYIQEYGGTLHTYEFKWNPKKKASIPKLFKEQYPDSDYTLINKENYWKHLL
jgi:hypothetical protein